MLVLLPPSETKRPGGVGVSVDRAAIIWAALDPARQVVIDSLLKLCADPDLAAKRLKLGKKSIGDIAANLEIMTSGTMPALRRYTGTLYDALGFETLSEQAIKRASDQLFIQSALFGLVPAMEQIPYYRLSAGTSLPGVVLAEIWKEAHAAVWPRLEGEVLDMRSKAYVAINPVPETKTTYFVEVLEAGSGRALNHFNKKAKGAFARSILENGMEQIGDAEAVAAKAGLAVRLDGKRLELLVPTGF